MLSTLKRRYHILHKRMESCDRKLENELKKQSDEIKQREVRLAALVEISRKKENTWKLATYYRDLQQRVNLCSSEESEPNCDALSQTAAPWLGA